MKKEKKQNKQNYWFVRREYGWGWRPSSWQGYLSLSIWVIAFMRILYLVDKNSHSASDTFYGSIIPLLLITSTMWIVCWAKGQPPKWQWGNK